MLEVDKLGYMYGTCGSCLQHPGLTYSTLAGDMQLRNSLQDASARRLTKQTLVSSMAASACEAQLTTL